MKICIILRSGTWQSKIVAYSMAVSTLGTALIVNSRWGVVGGICALYSLVMLLLLITHTVQFTAQPENLSPGAGARDNHPKDQHWKY